MRRILALAAVAAILSACAHTPAPPQVIDARYVSQVQGELKRQIGIYQRVVAEIHENAFADPAQAAQGPYWCGRGAIDFDVASVKVDLATTSDVTTSAGASASVPIASVIKIGPSGSHSEDVTNTEELAYNVWPVPYESQPEALKMQTYTQADLDSAPIANLLMTLRTGLIEASKSNALSTAVTTGGARPSGPQACVLDYNIDTPSADPGNTYKLGLTVAFDDKLGVTLGIGILSLNANAEDKSSLGNTLTVSFRQANIPFGLKRCTADPNKYCLADGKVYDLDPGVGLGVELAPQTKK